MNVPDYINDEIKKYTEEKRSGIDRTSTYNTILSLIGLARTNGRITDKEAEEIQKMVDNIRKG